MRPRSLEGLRGLISMHFLHGDWQHLLNNSVSFLVLNTLVFFFYRNVSVKVLTYIAIIGGIILWIIGRDSNHIGASLIIFGEAAFLFFSGLFSRNPMMLRVGLAVAFYYGSMVWWIFPVDPTISWEGHLSGAAVGIVLAYLFKDRVPERKKYSFEIEEEYEKKWAQLPDKQLPVRGLEEIVDESKPRPIEIKYHYKPKKEE